MRGVFDRIIAGDSTFGTDYGLEAFTENIGFQQGPGGDNINEIDKAWGVEVDRILDGKTNLSASVRVMETPHALQLAGANNN
ncbi:MAG: hypothetical protein LBQ58_09375 [Synergistaceae bacterium]|jgi:hypothetical protein|nr:hypothetical protein [Synergistaceae bacterium]